MRKYKRSYQSLYLLPAYEQGIDGKICEPKLAKFKEWQERWRSPNYEGRTRFLIDQAEEYKPRLAALVFLVAALTQRRAEGGKRGRKAWYHNTRDWIGKQLGVSGRHASRLLKQAEKEGLVGHERTVRGIKMWLISSQTRKLMKEGRFATGYYDIELANELGINASIILDLLWYPRRIDVEEDYGHLRKQLVECYGIDADKLDELRREAEARISSTAVLMDKLVDRPDFPEWRVLDYKALTRRLPWIKPKVAEIELRWLYELGLLDRRVTGVIGAVKEGVSYAYFLSENYRQYAKPEPVLRDNDDELSESETLDSKYRAICNELFRRTDSNVVELKATEIWQKVKPISTSALFGSAMSLGIVLKKLAESKTHSHLVQRRALDGCSLWTIRQS